MKNHPKSIKNAPKIHPGRPSGALLGSGGTLGTLGTLKGPKRDFVTPLPPLRRVTFWSLFAKYYQKCVFMLIFCHLFPVLFFEAKMDPPKEGWT